MGRPTTLTREWLEAHHIVDVSKDGVVTAISKQGERYILNPIMARKKSKWKIQEYHLIGIYDKEEHERQKISYAAKGTQPSGVKTLALARIIWAWHHGECPGGMDVDHINGDSLDDRLDNLQLLTRKENLAKRSGYRNQFEKSKISLDDNHYYKAIIDYVQSKYPNVIEEGEKVLNEKDEVSK